MRAGIIVRANQRGLGTQTYEAWRNYGFDQALLVLDGNLRWPEDESLYPGAMVTRWGEGLPRSDVFEFLESVDVVFSVETLYDPRFPAWAKSARVGCLIQGNPEFYRREGYTIAPRWTWPTPWLVAQLPPGEVVPVPSTNVIDEVPDAGPDVLRVLHPAGHAALWDRNGTLLFLESLRSIQTKVHVRLITQDESFGRDGRLPRLGRNVRVDAIVGGVDDRWSMYDDIDVVVLPRRYGGLCLPAQEAMARGCAVMMTDCPPNDWWPTVRIPGAKGRGVHPPFGPVGTTVANPRMIARVIDKLNSDRGLLAQHRAQSHDWALTHSWKVLRPVYTALLEDSAGG